jgi:hypothetical protein
MGQTTHQIEAHIEDTRKDLGSNLRELERKVRSVTDWKQHFQSNPMTMLGVAFGGGLLLATMLGGRKRERGFSSPATGSSEVLARLGDHHAQVFRTDWNGLVTVRTDGKHLTVESRW